MNKLLGFLFFICLQITAAERKALQEDVMAQAKKMVLLEFDPFSCEQHAHDLCKQLMTEMQEMIPLQCQLKSKEGQEDASCCGLYYVWRLFDNHVKQVDGLTEELSRVTGVRASEVRENLQQYREREVLQRLIVSEQKNRRFYETQKQSDLRLHGGNSLSEERKKRLANLDAASNEREAQYQRELLVLLQGGNGLLLDPSNSLDEVDQLLLRGLKL